jgi:hypothetical protein
VALLKITLVAYSGFRRLTKSRTKVTNRRGVWLRFVNIPCLPVHPVPFLSETPSTGPDDGRVHVRVQWALPFGGCVFLSQKLIVKRNKGPSNLGFYSQNRGGVRANSLIEYTRNVFVIFRNPRGFARDLRNCLCLFCHLISHEHLYYFLSTPKEISIVLLFIYHYFT